MRLPIRQIQGYLLTLHGVRISSGEIVELLHRIKAQMQPHLDALKREICASPAVQADETGWREDGTNGYIWSVSTPSIRYYEYHHSRSGEVVKDLIGDDFGGVLGSDFYAGYNSHQGLTIPLSPKVSTSWRCLLVSGATTSKRKGSTGEPWPSAKKRSDRNILLLPKASIIWVCSTVPRASMNRLSLSSSMRSASTSSR
jgi:hypothetical protein